MHYEQEPEDKLERLETSLPKAFQIIVLYQTGKNKKNHCFKKWESSRYTVYAFRKLYKMNFWMRRGDCISVSSETLFIPTEYTQKP